MAFFAQISSLPFHDGVRWFQTSRVEMPAYLTQRLDSDSSLAAVITTSPVTLHGIQLCLGVALFSLTTVLHDNQRNQGQSGTSRQNKGAR